MRNINAAITRAGARHDDRLIYQSAKSIADHLTLLRDYDARACFAPGDGRDLLYLNAVKNEEKAPHLIAIVQTIVLDKTPFIGALFGPLIALRGFLIALHQRSAR